MLSVPTMTAPRQERYGWRPGIALFALIGGLSRHPASIWRASISTAPAATTERVVVNRYSGLAIEGFDPVAYFTEQLAIRGRPISRPATPAPSGASAMRATAPPLSPIPNLRAPVRRLRSDRSRARRDLCRQSAVLGGRRDSGFICSAARNTATPSPPIRRASCKDANARWPALEQDLAQEDFGAGGSSGKVGPIAGIRTAISIRRRGIAPGDELRHDEIRSPRTELQGGAALNP